MRFWLCDRFALNWIHISALHLPHHLVLTLATPPLHHIFVFPLCPPNQSTPSTLLAPLSSSGLNTASRKWGITTPHEKGWEMPYATVVLLHCWRTMRPKQEEMRVKFISTGSQYVRMILWLGRDSASSEGVCCTSYTDNNCYVFQHTFWGGKLAKLAFIWLYSILELTEIKAQRWMWLQLSPLTSG